MATPASAAFVPSADRFAPSAAKADQLIDLNVDANKPSTASASTSSPDTDSNGSKNVYLPEWIAEAKAYLQAQGLNYVPTQGNTDGAAAYVKSTDNSKPIIEAGRFDAAAAAAEAAVLASDSSPAAAYQVLDDGAEDVERMQWDALRRVIGTLRWYILLSAIFCCAGVVGVLRSQLLLSRLFVIHSFLDFLLSTLSLLALAIVCTYPAVRAHLCDEFGSGELQAWFSSSKKIRVSSISGGHTVSPGFTNDASMETRVSGGSVALDVTAAASGWETLLDGVFASENCEESFRSTIVPLLMVFGLFFTAVRLQCFFSVQRFYAELLRNKVHRYGYGLPTGANMLGSVESGYSTPMSQASEVMPRWKESKLQD